MTTTTQKGRVKLQMSRTIKAGHVYRQYSRDGMYIADYKSSRLAYEATGISLGSMPELLTASAKQEAVFSGA